MALPKNKMKRDESPAAKTPIIRQLVNLTDEERRKRQLELIRTKFRNLPCDKDNTLVKKVRRLLKEDPRKRTELALFLGISDFWLYKLISGNLRNPPANRVQYIYEKLTGKKLEL